MSVRLPNPLLLLPLLALLASCSGPGANTFAPACPRAAILGDAADVTRYRQGGGRDLTDLILAGRIVDVSGKCEPGDTSRQLATSLKVSFELTRGPAMPQRQVNVMIFVAVSEGDNILDKKLFPVHAEFPPNIDTVRLTTDAIPLVLPISKDKSGAAYALTAGFQLTPDELALNRLRSGR
jgi:hypothetical protein